MKDRRKEVGRLGENIAAHMLLEKGYVIVERNWTSRLGELDLIAQKDQQLVVVEVRTTCGGRYGYGFQSVDFRKQQKVRRLAIQYIQQKQLEHLPVRFDVVSVLLDRELNPLQIEHIEGAF
ncbi:MAG: YraN family protein [Thermoactinomyces sp.]